MCGITVRMGKISRLVYEPYEPFNGTTTMYKDSRAGLLGRISHCSVDVRSGLHAGELSSCKGGYCGVDETDGFDEKLIEGGVGRVQNIELLGVEI